MSEVIVRMEMPTVCDECPMMYDGIFCAATGTSVYPNHQARILKNGREFDPCENRLDDCPIVGVLTDEHGDLIDRDKFVDKYIRHYTEQERKMNLVFAAVEVKQDFADMIYEEDAVIAAERKDDEQIH